MPLGVTHVVWVLVRWKLALFPTVGTNSLYFGLPGLRGLNDEMMSTGIRYRRHNQLRASWASDFFPDTDPTLYTKCRIH